MLRLIIAIFLLGLFIPSSYAHDKESVYDRVIKSGKIRCGYTLYSVGLNKDPNTGELWGIYKDIIEAAAKKLDLKIEWTEEVGWGQQVEGLNSNRYDMICSPASITGSRARAADVSMTLYYSPVWIYVRSDDTRFDKLKRAKINNSSVKISTMDGEQTDAQARFYFPKAQRISLPQNSEFSSLLLNVTTGKADMTFVEPFSAYEFMETTPNSLKKLEHQGPLLLAANIILIKNNEPAFKSMINNSLRELFLSGIIDTAIDRYEKYPNSYARVSKPYEVKK